MEPLLKFKHQQLEPSSPQPVAQLLMLEKPRKKQHSPEVQPILMLNQQLERPPPLQ